MQTGWDAQKEALEAERADLLARLQAAGFSDVEAARQDADGSVAPVLALYDDVQRALDKLASGWFGTCERCQKDIPPERLSSMPAVRYCFACDVAASADAMPADEEDASHDEITAEHNLDEATELTIPAFRPGEAPGRDDEEEDGHTQQTDVAKLGESS